MPLPPKELYIIAEIASRWNVQIETIEDYLRTGKLKSVIFLPPKTMLHFTLQNNPYSLSDDDQLIYDVDHFENNCTQTRQGIFNLAYENIEWDNNGQAELGNEGLYLTLPEEEGYFVFDKSFIITKNDVLISLSELNRFETEHDIIDNKKNQASGQEKEVEISQDKDIQLHPKVKESLLKIIIVIAIKGYGYDPTESKSPIHKEIAEEARRMDLSIDEDTVRKWLKEAASLLPSNYEQTE